MIWFSLATKCDEVTNPQCKDEFPGLDEQPFDPSEKRALKRRNEYRTTVAEPRWIEGDLPQRGAVRPPAASFQAG